VTDVATYTIHLLKPDGTILAKKDVKAVRNYDAVEEAERLCATSPRCSGYEVWRGIRKLTRQRK
jgi:hypothetical protein